MDDRPKKRRGPLAWVTESSWKVRILILMLPVLYLASFGPACWLISYVGMGRAQPNPPIRAIDWIALAYVPIGQISLHGPAFAERWLLWYAGLGVSEGKPVLIPFRLHHWIVDRELDENEGE